MDLAHIKGHIPFYTELKLKQLELDAVRTGFNDEIRTRDRLIKELESEISRLESSVVNEQHNVSKVERSFEEKLRLKQEGYNRLLAEYNLAALERKEGETKLVEGMSEIMASVEREAKVKLEELRLSLEKKDDEVERLRVLKERSGMSLELYEKQLHSIVAESRVSNKLRADSLLVEMDSVKEEVEKLKKAIHVIADRNITLQDDVESRSEEGEKLRTEMRESQDKYKLEMEKLNYEFSFKIDDLTRRNQFLTEQFSQIRSEYDSVSSQLISAKSRISELTNRSDEMSDKLEEQVRQLVKQLSNSKTQVQESKFELHDAKREFEAVLKTQKNGFDRVVDENSALLKECAKMEEFLREEKEQHRFELDALQQQLEDEMKKLVVLDTEKRNAESRAFRFEESLANAENAIALKESEIIRLGTELMHDEETLAFELAQAKKDYSTQIHLTLSRAELLERERDCLVDALTETESKKISAEIQVAKTEAGLRTLTQEKRELEFKIFGLEKDMKASAGFLKESDELKRRLIEELEASKLLVEQVRREADVFRAEYERKEMQLQDSSQKSKLELETFKRVIQHLENGTEQAKRMHEDFLERIHLSHAAEIEICNLEAESLRRTLQEKETEIGSMRIAQEQLTEQVQEARFRHDCLKEENLFLLKAARSHRNQLAFITHELSA